MSKARMLFGMVGKNRCKGLLKRVEIVIFLGRTREDRRICRCSRKAAARVSGSVLCMSCNPMGTGNFSQKSRTKKRASVPEILGILETILYGSSKQTGCGILFTRWMPVTCWWINADLLGSMRDE